jgi:CopG family nickel-responsive transcriptional regulator
MTSSKGVTRFSVSLPPSLVKAFDDSWKSMGYESRSKAAHDAFRSFISEYKWRSENAEVAGTIVLVYYLDKPGLLNQIVEVQHRFENVVTSSMHLHLTKDKCMEIITVRGKASHIRNLSQELTTKKGVKELKFTAIAL